MFVVFKEYLLCMVLFSISNFVATNAMPQPQGCCDDPGNSCCSGGRGPPGGPPGGAGGPPGPPPRGMPPGGQQAGVPSNNYFNVTVPATIVIHYNGTLLAAPQPLNATEPMVPHGLMPNATGIPPNATAPNGFPLSATTPNGKLLPPPHMRT